MELTAPIVLKDLDRRIVYGPVLIPDVPDTDGDVVSADKVERVAHRFMEEYRLMEHMHTLKSVARPVESYIAPTDLDLGQSRVPKGSWVMGAKVVDDDAWNDVKSGKLTGFSVVAVPSGAMKGKTVEKKLTLAEIEASGQDWEVIAVGLVDQPAIPLAKWTAVKSANPSGWDRLRKLFSTKDVQDLLDSAEEESRKAESHERSDDMDEKEIAALVGSAVTEAISPVSDRLDAIEAAGKEAAKETAKKEKDAKEKAEGGPKTVTLTEEEVAEAVKNASEAAVKEAVAGVLVEFEKHIESKTPVSAKSMAESLRGQDGDGTSTKGRKGIERDAFGRRIEVNS